MSNLIQKEIVKYMETSKPDYVNTVDLLDIVGDNYIFTLNVFLLIICVEI